MRTKVCCRQPSPWLSLVLCSPENYACIRSVAMMWLSPSSLRMSPWITFTTHNPSRLSWNHQRRTHLEKDVRSIWVEHTATFAQYLLSYPGWPLGVTLKVHYFASNQAPPHSSADSCQTKRIPPRCWYFPHGLLQAQLPCRGCYNCCNQPDWGFPDQTLGTMEGWCLLQVHQTKRFPPGYLVKLTFYHITWVTSTTLGFLFLIMDSWDHVSINPEPICVLI